MRILKVTQAYHPHLEKGGPAIKVRAIAEHLTARGHRVTVETANHGSPWRTATRDVGGVEVVYMGYAARYRNLTVNPHLVPFAFRRLRTFDVVHIYGLYDVMGPTTAWFCRKWGVPYVVEPLGMLEPMVRSVRKKRVYHAWLGRPMLAGAARVIATSERERDELAREDAVDGHVVVRRNGVDLGEFSSLPPSGTFRRAFGFAPHDFLVLFLGRLSRKKGLALLVNALAGLPPRARLAVVGPDAGDGGAEDVETLCERLQLRERVVRTGALFGREKVAALADADVLVLPSRNENFGNVAAEAIACGTPVLVTDRCGIAPLLADRGGLVVPYETAAVRDGLARLLADPDLYERLCRGCPDVARELTWDEPITTLEGIYASVKR